MPDAGAQGALLAMAACVGSGTQQGLSETGLACGLLIAAARRLRAQRSVLPYAGTRATAYPDLLAPCVQVCILLWRRTACASLQERGSGRPDVTRLACCRQRYH